MTQIFIALLFTLVYFIGHMLQINLALNKKYSMIHLKLFEKDVLGFWTFVWHRQKKSARQFKLVMVRDGINSEEATF